MEIKEKILLIEDDKDLIAYVTALLSVKDYEVIQAHNGEMALHMAASHIPDLVLLDLGLPDTDGIEVLRSIREWSDVPVIVVSARQSEDEKVKVLDNGASDYVTKPFGSDELLARIRAAIRIHTKRSRADSLFINGGLTIDYDRRIVAVDGERIHLTPIEYRIVVLLAQNLDKVLTHYYILQSLWGPYASESQTLRVNVANIRRKIEKNHADPVYILTEVGVGYRMTDLGDTE